MLVSEVMLQQTQVARVLDAWPAFMARFPTPDAMAAAAPGEVIREWGRLGYPRRARRLWDTAGFVAERGWPDQLTILPGVGRYTAGALRALTGDDDAVAVDANIRRVVERASGRRLTERAAEHEAVAVAAPLRGRDRLLALMDVGALVCRPRAPRCDECPLTEPCATRGPLPGETRGRQARFAGSFRQRRGEVMATLRAGSCAAETVDAEALASLVTDGLAVVEGGEARLP